MQQQQYAPKVIDRIQIYRSGSDPKVMPKMLKYQRSSKNINVLRDGKVETDKFHLSRQNFQNSHDYQALMKSNRTGENDRPAIDQKQLLMPQVTPVQLSNRQVEEAQMMFNMNLNKSLMADQMKSGKYSYFKTSDGQNLPNMQIND